MSESQFAGGIGCKLLPVVAAAESSDKPVTEVVSFGGEDRERFAISAGGTVGHGIQGPGGGAAKVLSNTRETVTYQVST